MKNSGKEIADSVATLAMRSNQLPRHRAASRPSPTASGTAITAA